jgi:hypothetical protein
MSPTWVICVARLLFVMVRRLAIVCCWIAGIFMMLVLTQVMATDFVTGCKLAMAAMIAVSTTVSLVAARRRQTDLARGGNRGPATAAAELPVVRPSCVRCSHPTRGTGRLMVDDHGSILFLADMPSDARDFHYFGLDLEKASLWQLIARRWRVLSCPAFRRELRHKDRNLTIARHELRLATGFQRLAMGPTVLVGHEAAESGGIRIEEFFLSVKSQRQVRFPTADPQAWVRDLALPATPSKSLNGALRHRTAIRRRLAWADVAVGAAVSGTVFLAIGLLLALACLSSGETVAGLITAAAMAGIWGAVMAVSATCQLICNR